MVMQQLMYSGEVRSMKDIDIERSEVKANELKLARQLIDAQSSEKFDPSQYGDEVSARIEAAIAKKVEGQEITLSEAPQTAQVIDLMEALRASLDRKPPKKGASAPKADDARKPAKRAAAAEPPASAAKKKVKSA